MHLASYILISYSDGSTINLNAVLKSWSIQRKITSHKKEHISGVETACPNLREVFEVCYSFHQPHIKYPCRHEETFANKREILFFWAPRWWPSFRRKRNWATFARACGFLWFHRASHSTGIILSMCIAPALYPWWHFFWRGIYCGQISTVEKQMY
jgi:hypothetical protein